MAEVNLDARLALQNLDVSTTDELFDALGGALRDAGFAKDSYPQALKDREATFPTGLPVSGGVAIPHTDPAHVLQDTIGIATLAHPVTFREMGGADDATVEVSTVFMLAFTAGEKHIEVLSEMVGCIQDETFIQQVRNAADPQGMVDALQAKLG